MATRRKHEQGTWGHGSIIKVEDAGHGAIRLWVKMDAGNRYRPYIARKRFGDKGPEVGERISIEYGPGFSDGLNGAWRFIVGERQVWP